MKRALAMVSLTLMLSVAAGCFSARHRTPEATQENFGVNMAMMNLWREALFRFQRAVQMNPGDAMAHNNLAVAFEANGDFESAAKEYREAMRLDKSNSYIQKNYSRYVEFTSRNKKRQRKEPPTKTAAVPETSSAAPPVATPPPATDTAPPPPTDTATPAPAKPPGDLR